MNDITVNQVNLEDFVNFGYAFNLIDANKLIVTNLKCTASNSTTQNRSMIFRSTGGCLRTIDISYRNFENLKIHDSFSDKTTYGIIIKDNPQMQIFPNNTTKVAIH